jgi:hypothetical protein
MCLPTTTDVLAAQQHDAVTQSYRAQLLDLGTTCGKAKLRAQGIDEKRICELSQYTLDENQVLRYSPALAHYYNSEGLPCDANGALIAPTTVTEDREQAMIVVPKVLQHAVMYLHHYPRLAGHPGWADMLKWHSTANIVQANVQTVQGVLQRHSHPTAQTRAIHLTALQASIRSTIVGLHGVRTRVGQRHVFHPDRHV